MCQGQQGAIRKAGKRSRRCFLGGASHRKRQSQTWAVAIQHLIKDFEIETTEELTPECDFALFAPEELTNHEVPPGVQVIGTHCVRHCANNMMSLPTSKPHPVLSYLMAGKTVSCSGLTPEEKSDLRHRVRCMGGTYQEDLDFRITHLACAQVGSAKYHAAIEMQVALVQPGSRPCTLQYWP